MATVQGAENYLMSWPSNQLDEIMWNGLGEYEAFDNVTPRMGCQMNVNASKVAGSPEGQLSPETPQIYGSIRNQSSGTTGNDINSRAQTHSSIETEYMSSSAWESMNASDLASFFVSAFPSERTSAHIEVSEDDNLLYNGNQYFLQSEKNPASSKSDIYVVDNPHSEDDESPAATTSNGFADTNHIKASGASYKLQFAPQEIEEKESPTNGAIHERNYFQENMQHYFVGRSGDRVAHPSSSLFPFMDSKSLRAQDREEDYQTNRGGAASSNIKLHSLVDSGNRHMGLNKHSGTMNMMNVSAGKTYINQGGARQDLMPARFSVREDQGSAGGKSWCSNGRINDNGTHIARNNHALFLGFPSHGKSKAGEVQTNQGQGLRVRAEPHTRLYFQELSSMSTEQASAGDMHQGMGKASQSLRIESGQCTQPFFRETPPLSTGPTTHPVSLKRSKRSHSFYPQQHQLRVQMAMGSQFHHERQTQQSHDVSSSNHQHQQCELKRGLGMDLMVQKGEASVEGTVLQQLECTIKDMAITKRITIRDSFYRLAKGVKERRIEAESNTTGKYDSPCISSSLKLSSYGALETKTNAFDRWMVNLVFHKQS